jgi:adhesin transport system outer membrane protein
MAWVKCGGRGVVLPVLCFTFMAGYAQAAPLEQELSALVQNHPVIQSGQALVSASESGVKASLAPYLPSVDTAGEIGYGRVSMPAFRASPDGPFDSEVENWNISIKETLWDGGARDAARAGSKLQRDAANFSLVGSRQAIFAEGITAYLNVLRQQELVKLSQQNEMNIRSQLKLEDERVNRGIAINVDVLQAKSRLQVSLERLTAVRGGFQEAMARYEQVFNHPAEISAMSMPPSPASQLPISLEDAVRAALADHPAVQVANTLIAQTAERKEGIKAEYQPRIDLVASRTYQSDWAGVPGIRRDSIIQLKATWNLFAGLGTRYRVQQTAFEEIARQDDFIQAKRKAEELVKVSWISLRTAEERVTLLSNAVNIAGEVYESRKKLRENGKETVINVLDAENEVFNAQINYTGALYDARIAAYEVLRAIGRLELATLRAAN